ncbi:MAG: porin PorA family protein [Candidatus Thermoplasmatota archaeon]|nr:porin PorA family protein [Candidatus Thermoplasmatota archaeon]
MNMVLGVVFIALGLIAASAGAFFMNEVSKAQKAPFPEDFDEHFTYGGYMEKLNLSNGQSDRVNFTVDRHIMVEEVLSSDRLLIDERISGKTNGSGLAIPDLDKHHRYTVDGHELILYHVENFQGYDKTYTAEDEVQWIFPHPLEKKDAKVWNMNILTYSEAHYMGEEERGGVNCYVFRGEEINYSIPLTPEQAAGLPPNSSMTLSLWEKAWVHPMTGTIVDFAKEIRQYLFLPVLPPIPPVKYPDDLNSTTSFSGSLRMFDQAAYSFMELENITAVRNLLGSPYGGSLNITETIDVFDPLGFRIDLLSSHIDVEIDPVTGMHKGVGRTGHYLFPITGVEPINYTFWDDGFGKEVTAAYTGMDTTAYSPHTAYIYDVNVEVEPYMPGGTATLNMRYYVEPATGIVLDVKKSITNWREQDARRLPLDTTQIDKTMHFNTRLTTVTPFTGPTETIDLIAVQMINCSGYTDESSSTAKITETTWMEYPNGTVYSPPVGSRFGVDAYTMEYVNVDGWSNVPRTGYFTFPVGIANEEGELMDNFTLYNSDLGISLPAPLTGEVIFLGRDAATYRMAANNVTIPPEAAESLIGMPLQPGVVMKYSCEFVYTVDLNTGSLLDLQRSISNTIYPPTYREIYYDLDSTSVLKGSLGGDNLTMTNHVTSSYLADGIAMIDVESAVEYDDGSDFLPPSMSSFPIDVDTHRILNETLEPTGTYWNFPPNPMSVPAYPMMMKMSEQMLFGIANMTSYTDDAVKYLWENMTIMDAGLFNPAFIGMNLSVHVITTQRWMVDRTTGSILDTNITMNVYTNLSLDPIYVIEMYSDTQTLMGFQMANVFIGWAIGQQGIEIISAEVSMPPEDSAMATAKAAALSNALLVADGIEPALELDLEFDEETVAGQMALVVGTKENLALLGKLKAAHGLDQLLRSKDNEIAYVYYKQVPEDIDDNKGSVKYWGDFAKDKEESAKLYGQTIPLLLYALAVILVIAAISFFLMKPKEEGLEE